jgi:hypothetical protein
MVGTTKNYDILFLQMRNYLPDLSLSMAGEYADLVLKLESILVNSKSITKDINSLVPSVFNFRMKAIQWLFGQHNLSLSKHLDETYHKFETLQQGSIHKVLIENILFALRCNRRVINSLVSKSEEFSYENTIKNISSLPTINYDQFLASLVYGMPNDERAQQALDWINSSLYIEIITVSAILINEKGLDISAKNSNELAFIISDAAQEYIAIAYEMGILSRNKSRSSILNQNFDDEFLDEQKNLADTGINDFALNL